MAPKRTSPGENIKCSKKRNRLSIDKKIEIIKRIEGGEQKETVMQELGLPRSSLDTILKDKIKYIETENINSSVRNVSYRRDELLVEMEEKLIEWLKEQNKNYIPISSMLLQEKAIANFDHVKASHSSSSKDSELQFVASRGWLHRFKQRASLHNVKLQGEAADFVV